MTHHEYLEQFKQLQADKVELTTRKNADYADEGDAFLNFRLVETLTAGKITAEMGLLVRMSDKMQRIANLVFRDNRVMDEGINDTLKDLAIYSDILNLYLRNKEPKTPIIGPVKRYKTSRGEEVVFCNDYLVSGDLENGDILTEITE